MKIAQIAQALYDDGVRSEALDELVYEMACDASMGAMNSEENEEYQEHILETAEAKASAINNGGLDAQVEYLVLNHGFDLQQLKDWLEINAGV